MLIKSADLNGATIAAKDADIGSVRDLYLDDTSWAIRYLVVDAGGWLSGRSVLISPISISRIEHSGRIAVTLNREQVRNSPPVDSDRPVSRRYESDYFAYYGFPPYWGGPMLWGMGAYPTAPIPPSVETPREAQLAQRERDAHDDDHLRSANEVRGYRVNATDGEIGHIEDLVVDDRDWAVRYLIVDTRNWWPGKKTLVSPAWTQSVSWAQGEIHFKVTRQVIRDSPAYDALKPINREYEARLHNHYGRGFYWLP